MLDAMQSDEAYFLSHPLFREVTFCSGICRQGGEKYLWRLFLYKIVSTIYYN